ncbi:MAG: hypothetical protein Q9162_000825 [Coniocarpon cinnabarinum]
MAGNGAVPKARSDDEEDDYMSTAFLDQPQTKVEPESSLKRKERFKREAAQRARPLSKEESQRLQEEQQKAALSTSIEHSDGNNVGLNMMKKLGFKPGDKLGKEGGLAQPIDIDRRDGRAGIGTKAKRKEQHESGESEAKRAKVDETAYVERIRQSREHQRLERETRSAMKVAEQLDSDDSETQHAHKCEADQKPDVVWRSLCRERTRHTNKAVAHEEALSRKKTPHDYGEVDDDDGGDSVPGSSRLRHLNAELDGEETDEELDQFESLKPAQKLDKVVQYLRQKHRYCYWCKMGYDEEGLPGCPGTSEEDHD